MSSRVLLFLSVDPLGLEPRLFCTKNRRVASYTMGQSYLEKTPIEVANLRTNFKFLKLYGKIIEALIVILTKNGYLKINILNFADK